MGREQGQQVREGSLFGASVVLAEPVPSAGAQEHTHHHPVPSHTQHWGADMCESLFSSSQDNDQGSTWGGGATS